MVSGLGQDQEFPCRPRVDGTFSKMKIGDESYLEFVLGIKSDGKLHVCLLRIFFKKTPNKLYFLLEQRPVLDKCCLYWGQKNKIGVWKWTENTEIVEKLNLGKLVRGIIL